MDAKIKKFKELNKEQPKQMSSVSESAMYGLKRTSFQDFGDYRVKIIHESDIMPEIRGARTRKIKRLYVESKDRTTSLELPSTNLQCARALASHLSRGGSQNDMVAEYIVESSKNLKSIKEFASACKTLSNSNIDGALITLKEAAQRIKNDMMCLQSNRKSVMIEQKINVINTLTEEAVVDNQIYNSLSVIEESGLFGDIPSIMKKIIKEQTSTCSIVTHELSSNSLIQEGLQTVSALSFDNNIDFISYVINETINVVNFDETKKVLSDIKMKLSEGVTLSAFEKASIKAILSQGAIDSK
jgi:hypothetical protein